MNNHPLVLPFSAINKEDLLIVGGKGANLGEMTQAGFPVPSGFCVTTVAFEKFIEEGNQAETLYSTLSRIKLDHLDEARHIGQQVRETLRVVSVPGEIKTAVLNAHQAQGPEKAYAVRSSATAEDLPAASFAGQQDTYLNVKGADELITAVRNCWISLFTDRAILYRIQNGFDHRQVSLSVVVQEMVLPDVSGIMFTADPLSGDRDITTIDASYGLGEALVAGIVSADLYKINRRTYTITEIQVADKRLAIRPSANGGTFEETITGTARNVQVLSEAQAIILAEIGHRIAAHYGQPQDIEWALTNGKFTILQSRPITSLFPIPKGALRAQEVFDEIQVMFSFASVQGVMGPITPLGRDTLRTLITRAGRMFNIDKDIQSQRIAWTAAERLWLNFTAVVRHPIGRKIIKQTLPMIDSEAADALLAIWDEPQLKPAPDWFKPQTFRRIGFFMRPILARIICAMCEPDATRDQYRQEAEVYLTEIQKRYEATPTLKKRLDFFYGPDGIVANAFPFMFPRLLPPIAGGMASLNLLNKLSKNLPPETPNPLIFTRGLPHNVTTEMDLALWHTAQTIRGDKAAATFFLVNNSRTLSDAYLAGELPVVAQTAVSHFLSHYGMRGLAEIDIGQPRWRENPAHIMQVLQSYLQIEDPKMAPDAVFTRGAAEAKAAIVPFQTAVSRTRFGQIKAKLVPPAIYRLRALAGGRETPKFMIIRIFGIVRQGLLENGQELAAQGIISRAEDLFYLKINELYALAAGEARDWQALITERRASAAREKKRQHIPRLLLSDGRVFYEGGNRKTAVTNSNTITGSPVSPGLVEGIAHVVFNPHESQLKPGEILVCPGTDPAWTPLFLAAGGLITEVGGLMTHGSVVAREYGIPAVVGVNNATTLIQTGQKIRLDGSLGRITLL